MKNLHTLLEKSNMRPRERVFILVKHEAHELKTGEAILDTLDIRGLTRVWKPEGNHEIREYNRYLNFWNSFKLLDVDIQTLYFCLQLNIANIDKLLLAYCHQEDTQKLEKILRKVYGKKEDGVQMDYVLKNTGLEYAMVIHRYTFSLLPKKLKTDLELMIIIQTL